MSIPKIVRAITCGDSKDFESELARLDSHDRFEVQLIDVYVAIIHKNDLDAMKTFISFLEENNITMYGPSVYAVNSNQWDMIKLMYESKTCINFDTSVIMDSDDTEAVDKAIEHGIMTELEVKINILGEMLCKSYKMYQKIINRYPGELCASDRRLILHQCYENSPSVECLKAYVDLLDVKDQVDTDIFRNEFNLERYNILVQKVPKDKIIEGMLDAYKFNFDPDLIDIIGIRNVLQTKINYYESVVTGEARQINVKLFSAKLLMYSGLDFKKKYLKLCLMDLRTTEFENVITNLPDDYYTDQEKSNMIMSIQKNVSVSRINFLIKLGWKIMDTPENRENWELNMSIYFDLPKY